MVRLHVCQGAFCCFVPASDAAASVTFAAPQSGCCLRCCLLSLMFGSIEGTKNHTNLSTTTFPNFVHEGVHKAAGGSKAGPWGHILAQDGPLGRGLEGAKNQPEQIKHTSKFMYSLRLCTFVLP